MFSLMINGPKTMNHNKNAIKNINVTKIAKIKKTSIMILLPLNIQPLNLFQAFVLNV